VIERLDGAVPLAVNPMVTELPGEMLPLYGSLATVTFAPALLMTTWAWKPPDQEFITEYVHDRSWSAFRPLRSVLIGWPPLPSRPR
jgi:hypothetical protein